MEMRVILRALSCATGSATSSVGASRGASCVAGFCETQAPAKSSPVTSVLRAALVARSDDRLDAAANVEVTDYLHGLRLARLREIVEDAVHRTLVEDSVVAKAPQIQLQGLELETHFSGHVGDEDRAEIRGAPLQLLQLLGVGLDSTHRAQRRELVAFHMDLVVPLGIRIGER